MRQLILFLPALGLLSACQSSNHAGKTEYQTVEKDPRRDTDTARRENDAALALIAKNNYDGAEQALRRALAADVMFGPAHNTLGMVYFHRSQLYLAAWEFQYAIKLMPEQPEPRNNLGLVFEAGGKLDQAISSYDAALKNAPDNAQFVGNDARARLRRGEHGQEVRKLLEKLVLIDSRAEWVNWAREHLALMGHHNDG